MTHLVFLGACLLCVLFQTNLFLNRLLLPFPFKPDVTIPLVVYFGLTQQPLRGGLYVLWVGYLMDLFSGCGVGFYLFMRQFMFFITQLVRRNVFLEHVVLQALLTLAFFLVESVVVYLMIRLPAPGGFLVIPSLKQGALQGFVGLLVWYLVFPALTKLEEVSSGSR